MAHHLPSLTGLSLGPPTGPMARYGKEVFEPPSQGKRQRGASGLTVNISRWEPEEGNPKDLFTRQPFIPGQWVYKTPTDVPGQPHYETPTNYDPWMLEQYWAHQTPTWLSGPPGAPMQKYVKDPLGAVIPYAEYEALAQWVNDPNNKKPESPPSTPFDPADYVHKPPAGAREPPPQSPVAPAAPRTEGALDRPRHIHDWQILSLGLVEALVRRRSFLTQWAQRLSDYILRRRSLGELPNNVEPSFSAGFVQGKITVDWYISHETGGVARTPRPIRTRGTTGADAEAGFRVEKNYLEVSCAVSPNFVGHLTLLGVQGTDSRLRKQVLRAFVNVGSDSELNELARTISIADFEVYLGREGGAIYIRPGEPGRRPFEDTDRLEMTLKVSPRLLAAIEKGRVLPGQEINFPTNAELVADHYGAQEGHYALKAYPAFYSRAPGMSDSPEETQDDINDSKARWKSIIAWFVRGLYKAIVDARDHTAPRTRGTTRYLAAPPPLLADDLVRFYSSPDAYTLPTARLADFVVDGNYAQWENGYGPVGAEDSEYHQWVDVPFWFAEAIGS